MGIIVILIFIGGVLFFRSLGTTIQDVKYAHRKCPFCGSDVSGRRSHTAIGNSSFVNYNCSCGAYANASSKIWHRKKVNAKNDFDTEMRWEE